MAQAYRVHKFVSPMHDARGRLDTVLAAQLRGYALEDPEPRRPQAIPAAVVSMVAASVATESHRAIGQLVTGAFFFAMRSCEYSDVNGKRRTRVVRVGDVEFRKQGRIVDPADERQTADADTVSVTYRTQKNGERGVTVTQHRTQATGSEAMCPVRAFAGLVARIRRYETDDTRWTAIEGRPINLAKAGDQMTLITSYQVLHHLRTAALLYGEDRLGFKVSNIGTHSLRSGAATAMYLAGVPVETIQLIGRWRSQTFLRYIRIQVQQLTRGVANEMTTNPNFMTVGQT